MKNLSFMAVCQYFGSQRKAAKAIGCTPGMIGHVIHGRRPMPTEWAPKIEAATKGKFLAEELAPNVRWDVLVKRGREQGEKTVQVEQK